MSKEVNMFREKDTLHEFCRKDAYSVPDGYFGQLQERLMSIPRSRKTASKHGAAAYLALAGGIAAVAAGGFAILKSTAQKASYNQDYVYEQLLYADALPQSYSLYNAFEQAAASSEVSLEEYFDNVNE